MRNPFGNRFENCIIPYRAAVPFAANGATLMNLPELRIRKQYMEKNIERRTPVSSQSLI
jgi:hypothetical protein